MKNAALSGLILSVLVSMLFTSSCSKKSSDSGVSGQGSKQAANALVCLDVNGNYECDSSEPTTRSAADGTFTLDVASGDTADRQLVLVADGETVDTATNAPVRKQYALVSQKGNPNTVSVYTTMLACQSTLDEAALKNAFQITEDASLVSGYAPDGEIDTLGKSLHSMYINMYAAAAAAPGTTTESRMTKVVAALIANPALVLAYADRQNSQVAPPATNAAVTSTSVGDEIFQNIPIDASTMSFGVGMDEITRKIVSGSYCLDVPEIQAVPKLAISQNNRNYQFRLIRSEKDLRESLNVGGGLDLGTQVVQGSLEGRFVNEFRNNTDAIFALIRAEYVLSGYKLFGVSLNTKFTTTNANLASYVSNYADFRKACGDRYLDQITTGGAYYGLLKITTSDSTKKQDLQVKLDGKYGKAGVSVSVHGDLQSTLNEALKNTNVSITIGSRGISPKYLGLANPNDPKDPNAQLIQNLDDFFSAANAFMTTLSDGKNDCYDDAKAPKVCAYTATFADYATISDGIPRNATQVQNLNFTTKLMGQYEDYNILNGMMNDIMLNQPDYNWARTDVTYEDVFYMQQDLLTGQDIMDAAFRKCSTDFTGCTNNQTAQSLQTFNEIRMKLPMHKLQYARDCQDVQRMFDITANRDATVYLSGDRTKPFNITCARMDTTEPETYLKLSNTSGSPSTLSYNMGQNVNPDGSLASSIFTKLMINVNYDNVEIINDQTSEISTSTTATSGSPTADKNFSRARLGTAVDCFVTTNKAMANIDLTNTKFKFDDNLTYVTSVHPVSKYEYVSIAAGWDAADAAAKAKGGHLVVIDNITEYAEVVKIQKAHSGGNTWIGLKRTDLTQTAQSQQFQWVSTPARNLNSYEVSNYFASGEPNNYKGLEHCVHLYGNSGGNKMNDLPCSTNLPYIIEYEKAAPNGTAAFNADRTAVTLSVTGQTTGVCTEIHPATNVIRLQYKPL